MRTIRTDGGRSAPGGPPSDGRRSIVEPLLARVAPEQILACAVDLGPGEVHDLLPPTARSCDAAGLEAALGAGPHLVLVHGNLSWHALRVLAPVLGAAPGHPVLVFESGRPDPIPDWATDESRDAQRRRVEAVTLGIFAGIDALAGAFARTPAVVRCGVGRLGAAIVPPEASEPVLGWLDATAPILDGLEHERRSLLDARAQVTRLDAELHHVDELIGEVLASPRWLAPPFVRAFRGLERHRTFSTAGRLATLLAHRIDPDVAVHRTGDRPRSVRGRIGHAVGITAVRFEQLGRIGTVSLARGPQIELGQRVQAAASVDPTAPDPILRAHEASDSHGVLGALRVTYVVPILRIAGGILGVTQLANELALLGASTGVVAAEDRAEVYRWRFLAPPTVYAGADELIEHIEPTDVVVATHWSTVAWADEIVRRGRARTAAYFLQDYEAWFYPDDPELQAAVRASYEVIETKIVKSDWLAGLVAGDGHATHKIPLGYDLGFFHPREVERPDHPVVFAMARPRTPRRGFPTLVAALERVHREVPDAEIVLFGSDLSATPLPFPFRDVGMVTDQEQLARLYSGAHVHIDASDFQAFGRPALEAMGCGAASVLTDVGGVGEYAVDGRNCLLVPPGDPEAMASAVVRLCRDADLRDRIRHAGFDTVIRYSMKEEARSTLALFQGLATSAPAIEGCDPVGHGASEVHQVRRQQG